MQPIHSDDTPTRWYRNFWAWVVIGIPLLTVVAGISTIFIASNSRDSLVSDDYYREGLAINQQAERSQFARQHQISAVFDIHSGNDDMRIVLQSDLQPLPTELILTLFHPTLQEYDLTLRFRRHGKSNQYHTPARSLPDGRWDLTLQPADANWRIQGKLQLSESHTSPVRLTP